jgi:hypothetical protein
VAIQSDQLVQFTVAPHPQDQAAHQAAHLPEKENVVPVKSQSPCTFMWSMQLVGVIVTVLAHGANVVYCLVM